ncbi:hypothetical protein HOG47_01355, partial [archaeon]|nr:hypothetical protein [archaeon]
FCFEIVDKFENLLSWFGIKNAKLIPKKNNLNAPRDIKKKVLEYFESGEFVIPETSDYTSLNVGRQHDHGDLGIINCIVNEDFLGKSQSFENKGLTINPNINVYSKNNTELEYLHGISAPGLAPNRMNAKFHESKQFPGYSSN